MLSSAGRGVQTPGQESTAGIHGAGTESLLPSGEILGWFECVSEGALVGIESCLSWLTGNGGYVFLLVNSPFVATCLTL